MFLIILSILLRKTSQPTPHKKVLLSMVVFTLLTPGQSMANITGNNSENFNPATTDKDYTTVYSSKTLGAGNLGLGVVLDNAVNTLPYFGDDNANASTRKSINDIVSTLTPTTAYGITDQWDVGLALPAVIYQSVSNSSDLHGQYSQNGFTDLRLGTKYRAYELGGFGLAIAATANMGLVKGSPYEGDQKSTNFSTEIIADYVIGILDFAGNLGYKLRSGSESDPGPIDAFGNQLLMSGAVGLQIPSINGKWINEIYMSAPTSHEHDESNRHTTRAEALTGIRIFANDQLSYNIGTGTELRHSTASADWRVYAGLNYTIGTKSNSAPEVVEAPTEPLVVPIFDEEKPDEVIIIQDVLFKYNSDQLKGDKYKKNIDDVVKSLNKGDGFEKLIIEGHTCEIGSAKYNLGLSRRRAVKIRNILINDYNLPADRIVARGYGERRPIASNKTESGRAKNRRVEFKIYRKSVVEN